MRLGATCGVMIGLCGPVHGCSPHGGEPPSVTPVSVEVDDERYQEAIAAGRAFVDALMARYEFPGLSLAVGAGGALVWSEARGYADTDARVPLLPATPLRIHSISKPITSLAVGILVDRGRLDLDAPIQRYVPGFPAKRGPISVRLLGGHLAGIRHYDSAEEVHNQRWFRSVAESLEPFADDPLLHAPGDRHSYSSYGWNLIGAAVESLCGTPFPDCMSDLVFQPLALAATRVGDTGTGDLDHVRYYERNGSDLVEAAPFNLSNRWPAGGLLSTPSDLVRFGLAFLEDDRLSPETRSTLLAHQITSGGDSVPYGIGWALATGPGGSRVAFHQGGSTGGMSFLALLPEQRFVFAIIANLNGDLGSAEPPIAEAMGALGLFLEASQNAADSTHLSP